MSLHTCFTNIFSLPFFSISIVFRTDKNEGWILTNTKHITLKSSIFKSTRNKTIHFVCLRLIFLFLYVSFVKFLFVTASPNYPSFLYIHLLHAWGITLICFPTKCKVKPKHLIYVNERTPNLQSFVLRIFILFNMYKDIFH